MRGMGGREMEGEGVVVCLRREGEGGGGKLQDMYRLR